VRPWELRPSRRQRRDARFDSCRGSPVPAVVEVDDHNRSVCPEGDKLPEAVTTRNSLHAQRPRTTKCLRVMPAWRRTRHRSPMQERICFVMFATSLALACGGGTSVGSGVDAGADGTGRDGNGGEDAAAADDSGNDRGRPDGSTADAGADASTFTCGETACSQNQICLHPACGCIALKETDSGACPDGSTPEGDGGFCLPGCPTPSCWSSNGETLDCDGRNGTLSGSFDTSPQGTGLVCYAECL
jgi:hypothetical protein